MKTPWIEEERVALLGRRPPHFLTGVYTEKLFCRNAERLIF
jgi:hypothetical protein